MTTAGSTAPAPGTAGARRLWPDVRLHVVTGKGGTGKTTVAAALAHELAPVSVH